MIWNKKVFFSLHPGLPIAATIGEDTYLFLIDTERNRLLSDKFLEIVPTCINFSP